MVKKSAEKLRTTAEIADALERSPAAVTKAFRAGRFGATAQRGPRGELLFTAGAIEAFHANTDTARLPVDKLPTRRAAPAPAPAPAVDRPLAAACDEMTAAFMIDLWLKVTGLGGFDDLDEADQRELRSVFSTALDGMVLYGVPVAEASSWPPAFDPAYVAEVCRVD